MATWSEGRGEVSKRYETKGGMSSCASSGSVCSKEGLNVADTRGGVVVPDSRAGWLLSGYAGLGTVTV